MIKYDADEKYFTEREFNKVLRRHLNLKSLDEIKLPLNLFIYFQFMDKTGENDGNYFEREIMTFNLTNNIRFEF